VKRKASGLDERHDPPCDEAGNLGEVDLQAVAAFHQDMLALILLARLAENAHARLYLAISNLTLNKLILQEAPKGNV
jgi:hypothetical protein